MYKLIKELFVLLTKEQRKEFYILQILVIFMSFAEIIGVASIAPFMALVGDSSILQKDNAISFIYKSFSFVSPETFIFNSGVCVLLILTVSSLISTYTTWKLSMFGSFVGTQLSDRLYSYYMQQPWLFHVNSSSAQFVKQIATESSRVTNAIINPILQMNAKIVSSSFMFFGVLIYDPIIASSGLLIFFGAYFLLYKVVRKKLQRDGKLISNESTVRFRLMNEGFGGIKDILLLGKQNNFISFFARSGLILSRCSGMNNALSQVPKYFMELIAFGSIISLILYLVKTHHGNLGIILPVLSVYALAGFKLLPAFQTVYASLARIKGAISAFESIKDDLLHSLEFQFTFQETSEKLPVTQIIELKNVTFKYPNKHENALENLNMSIPVNSTIGIAGASGSGKSTAIDLLLGLLAPNSGSLEIDGNIITKHNIREWQNNIGYVAQNIFLSEGTIRENIAFGELKENIDNDKIQQAVTLAHLQELVNELPEGLETKVGERGIQLSGGQRQRIGIARALYRDAGILIFDEATSALDGITEKAVMDAIHDFSGKKTIIMIAHRLKTIAACDKIFFMNKGRVIDNGTYQELIQRNHEFKRMSMYS